MIESLARQADHPQQGMQMVRGRATTADPERELAFAFLTMPDSPVEALNGMARVAGNEAHAPRIELRNRGDRPVRHVEMGWLIKDQQGREFQAASMPADVALAPGRSEQVVQDAALRLPGASIQSMTGFVSSVEFSDGQLWVPSRAALTDPKLRKAVAPSPEEQRLTQIYLKKGAAGLIEELKKF